MSKTIECRHSGRSATVKKGAVFTEKISVRVLLHAQHCWDDIDGYTHIEGPLDFMAQIADAINELVADSKGERSEQQDTDAE